MARVSRIVGAALVLLCLTAAAGAADALPPPGKTARVLPFPRSEGAATVWDERSCWSACGSSCAWTLASCVKHDAQAVCLDAADSCDRACQDKCRVQGGPWLKLPE